MVSKIMIKHISWCKFLQKGLVYKQELNVAILLKSQFCQMHIYYMPSAVKGLFAVECVCAYILPHRTNENDMMWYQLTVGWLIHTCSVCGPESTGWLLNITNQKFDSSRFVARNYIINLCYNIGKLYIFEVVVKHENCTREIVFVGIPNNKKIYSTKNLR